VPIALAAATFHDARPASLSSTFDLPDKPFGKPHAQPCFQSLFSSGPNHRLISRQPFPIEGRFAIVTDVGFGMRWRANGTGTSDTDADGEVV
jgi:hypothetical protein